MQTPIPDQGASRATDCAPEENKSRTFVRCDPPLSMAEAAQAVARAHGLTVQQLRARTRERRIAHPRQEAMVLMRAQARPCGRPRFSCLQIARYFGLKNHSTCVHALKAARARDGARI